MHINYRAHLAVGGPLLQKSHASTKKNHLTTYYKTISSEYPFPSPAFYSHQNFWMLPWFTVSNPFHFILSMSPAPLLVEASTVPFRVPTVWNIIPLNKDGNLLAMHVFKRQLVTTSFSSGKTHLRDQHLPSNTGVFPGRSLYQALYWK